MSDESEKETSFDIARQAGLVEMLELLERAPKKVLMDRDSTVKNRERDIKQIRKLDVSRFVFCLFFLFFFF
jgi:hypothetical protein